MEDYCMWCEALIYIYYQEKMVCFMSIIFLTYFSWFIFLFISQGKGIFRSWTLYLCLKIIFLTWFNAFHVIQQKKYKKRKKVCKSHFKTRPNSIVISIVIRKIYFLLYYFTNYIVIHLRTIINNNDFLSIIIGFQHCYCIVILFIDGTAFPLVTIFVAHNIVIVKIRNDMMMFILFSHNIH